MANIWLCISQNTSKLLFLIIVLSAHFMHTDTTETQPTTTSITQAATAVQSSLKEHQNKLTDDLEHEEFIDSETNQPHSRQKRLIWITDDGRLALPPGTSLTFTPTIALPLVRHPPEGFFSNMSISFPVTIDFDKLGLTDNQNPLGDLPPIFARSFGRSAGHMLGEYVARYLNYKTKRDLAEANKAKLRENSFFQIKKEPIYTTEHDDDGDVKFPELPERFKHVFHGGERVMLYGVVENLLATFGMNGKACLLRTICEIHSRDLNHFGVVGEMVKLFLTVTRSPYADLIPEYVRAQEIGEGRQAPGECFPYYRECPKSIFKAAQQHKYNEFMKNEYHEQEAEEILSAKLPKNRNDLKRHKEVQTNEIESIEKQQHNELFSM